MAYLWLQAQTGSILKVIFQPVYDIILSKWQLFKGVSSQKVLKIEKLVGNKSADCMHISLL